MRQGEARAARMRAVWDERRGGGTLEFVVWTVVFAAMLAFVADLSLVQVTRASMWDAARDAARRVALHEMTAEQARAHAASAVALGAPKAYKVTVSLGGEDGTGDVVVAISTEAATASPLGLYPIIAPEALTAKVTMMQEPQ